jgi:hypothetical protein
MTGCKKGPAGCWGVGPAERSPGPGLPCHYNIPQPPYNIPQLPVAITWLKAGRHIVLGKLLQLDGRLCLATAYKWRVLPSTVSLPDLVVHILLRLGVRDWVVRDDLRRLAWHIDLRHLLKAPMRGGERHVPLEDMEPTPWVWWPYATKAIDLLELVQSLEEGRQLPLGEVRA